MSAVTATIVVAGIAALGSCLTAWIGLRNHRNIHQLHIQINSRMDAWMKSAEEVARAAGRVEGIAQEQQRRAQRLRTRRTDKAHA